MKICYVYADKRMEWNCSHWRCVLPTLAINKTQDHHAFMISMDDWMNEDNPRGQKALEADVVVIQRLIMGRALQQVLKHRSCGQTVVLDLDDSYHYIPPATSAYHYWIEGKTNEENGTVRIHHYRPIEQLEWGAKLVDGVTSPSQLICADWERYGVRTYWMPNYIESSKYPLVNDYRLPPYKMGWGGSG